MRSKNKIIILTLISLFLLLGIGYAYLSTELNMNAKVSVKKDCSGITNLYDKMACLSVPDNIKSEFVTNTTGIDFSNESSDTNGKGIYQAVKYEGEDTPIYYYRGNVKNNNVIFANKCWKIVRTTETKGVKLIYNGEIKYVSEIESISQDKYINVVNDPTYPYTYNTSTNEWTSTNKTSSKIGTITFNVSSPGDYQIAYSVSSEANFDKAKFYKNGTLLGEYSGEASGTIFLGEIDETTTIKVEYYKNSSGDKGSDSVTFSVGKAVGEVKRSCDNTGTASQIGTSAFNSSYNSLAYNGYMYGDVYSYKSQSTSMAGLSGRESNYKSSMGTTNYKYALNVIYDSPTGKYSLINSENRVWNDTYSTGTTGNQFLYTCFSEDSDTCAEVYYTVTSNDSSSVNYVTLKNGEKAEDILNRELVYGNDVTYDEATGEYTLIDTMTSKIGDWEKDRTTIGNKYHYTCLNENGTCSTVKYMYYISSASTRSHGSFYYVEFSNGMKVEEAVKKMTTESAHTKDSTIKTKVDTWYHDNMLEYDSKIEDTPYCNDREIGTYGGWDKDSPVGYLYYQKYNDMWSLYKPVLTCRNKNDAYTVSDTVNGNGDLTYKTGLLTADEITYAGASAGSSNRSYYLYTGQDWWSASPDRFSNFIAGGFYVIWNGNLVYDAVYSSNGARPVVSLVPGTRSIEGDGTVEDPFIVE